MLHNVLPLWQKVWTGQSVQQQYVKALLLNEYQAVASLENDHNLEYLPNFLLFWYVMLRGRSCTNRKAYIRSPPLYPEKASAQRGFVRFAPFIRSSQDDVRDGIRNGE